MSLCLPRLRDAWSCLLTSVTNLRSSSRLDLFKYCRVFSSVSYCRERHDSKHAYYFWIIVVQHELALLWKSCSYITLKVVYKGEMCGCELVLPHKIFDRFDYQCINRVRCTTLLFLFCCFHIYCLLKYVARNGCAFAPIELITLQDNKWFCPCAVCYNDRVHTAECLEFCPVAVHRD